MYGMCLHRSLGEEDTRYVGIYSSAGIPGAVNIWGCVSALGDTDGIEGVRAVAPGLLPGVMVLRFVRWSA